MGEIRTELVIICVFAMLVLLAMGIDFGSGWHKAAMSGTARKSQAMKRSVSKFILYEGAVAIAGGMDVVIRLCGFWNVLRLSELHGVPVVCGVITLFLMAIEIKSLRESASDKQRKDIRDMLDIVVGVVGKERLGELVRERIGRINDEPSEDNTAIAVDND